MNTNELATKLHQAAMGGRFDPSSVLKFVANEGIDVGVAHSAIKRLVQHFETNPNPLYLYFYEQIEGMLARKIVSERNRFNQLRRSPIQVFQDVTKMVKHVTEVKLADEIDPNSFDRFFNEGGLAEEFIKKKCERIKTEFAAAKAARPDERHIPRLDIYFATDQSPRSASFDNSGERVARPAYVRFFATETVFAALPDQNASHCFDCGLQHSDDGIEWKTVRGNAQEQKDYGDLLESQAAAEPRMDTVKAFKERQEALLEFCILNGAKLIDESVAFDESADAVKTRA